MRHRRIKKTQSWEGQKKRLININLCRALVRYGTMKTTLVKARASRSFMEKIITRAKVDNLNHRRYVLKYFPKDMTDKIFKEIAPKYKDRHGGYTRIIKYKSRKGDNAKLGIIEFI